MSSGIVKYVILNWDVSNLEWNVCHPEWNVCHPEWNVCHPELVSGSIL